MSREMARLCGFGTARLLVDTTKPCVARGDQSRFHFALGEATLGRLKVTLVPGLGPCHHLRGLKSSHEMIRLCVVGTARFRMNATELRGARGDQTRFHLSLVEATLDRLKVTSVLGPAQATT